MIDSELQSIFRRGGNDLIARFFRPECEPKGCVLIVPAMGVSQKFYAPLAAWLASQGFLVATFDYMGIGLSRRSKLRSVIVNIVDWATFDCEAMIDAVTKEMPAKPLIWLGHSLGGQIVGLVPGNARLTKIVTIACGSGYWLENAPSLKWKAWWMWYVAVPIVTRLR
jgi:predicted alpha/beta hydrolase